MDRPDQAESERQKPNGETDAKPRAHQFAPVAHLQSQRDRGKSADQAGHEQRRIDGSEKNAAPKTHEDRRKQAVTAPQQHAQDERGKGVGSHQSAGLRAKDAVMAAVAHHQHQLGDRELHQDDAEDQEDARGARKRFWLIDPELNQGGGEKEKRDDEILGGLGLLSAEDEKGEARDEAGDDEHFARHRFLEGVEQLVPGTTAP